MSCRLARCIGAIRIGAILTIALLVIVVGSAQAQRPRCEEGPCASLVDDGATVEEIYAATVARDPNVRFAITAFSAILVAETVRYWVKRRVENGSFQFLGLRDRFDLDRLVYDDNSFAMNFVGHPLTGLSLHRLARATGMSLPQSVALVATTSTLWEGLLESRFLYSINDIIITPGAGVALGEFFYWLHRDLEEHADGAFGTAMYWLSGPGDSLRGMISDRVLPRRDISHRFRLSAGFRAGFATVDDAGRHLEGDLRTPGLYFSGELAALPDYLGRRSYRLFFHEGNLTSLRFRLESGAGVTGRDVLGETVLLGWHGQNYSGSVLRAFTLGSSIAYHYRREDHEPWHDTLGILHLPGLAANAHWQKGRAGLHIRARLHADFGGIRARTSEAWKLAHPTQWGSSSIRADNYYFAWGRTARITPELELGTVAIGGTLLWSHYASHDGRDQRQVRIHKPASARRSLLETSGWLRVHFDERWFARATIESRHSRSRLGDTRGTQELLRYGLVLGAKL